MGAKTIVYSTFGDLLPTPNLANLLLEELVALLANVDNLLAGNAEILDSSENLLRDLSRSLVLRQGVGVVQGVIWQSGSVTKYPSRNSTSRQVSGPKLERRALARQAENDEGGGGLTNLLLFGGHFYGDLGRTR